MLIANRVGAWGRGTKYHPLPDGYRSVEYIYTSTLTLKYRFYTDIGTSSINDTFWIKFKASVVQDMCSFGIAARIYAFAAGSGSFFAAPGYVSRNFSDTRLYNLDIHEVTNESGTLTLDGVDIGIDRTTSHNASDGKIILFGRSGNTVAFSQNKGYFGRIYGFRYSKDGSEVINAIPCVGENNDAQFWDQVTGEFLRKEGTFYASST